MYCSLIWLFGLVGARQRFILWRIFATWQQKKRAGESNKGKFGNFNKNSPHFEEKKLEVARFRQCVTVGSQN